MASTDDDIPKFNGSNTPESKEEEEQEKEEQQIVEKKPKEDTQTIIKECVDKFSNYMVQFIDALVSVFPEDIKLAMVKTRLNMAVGSGFSGDEQEREDSKKKLISKWHQVMSVYYEDILARNDRFISSLKPDDFNGIEK